MELSLDSVDQVPKDTFVSIRVGDYQKQSRFGSAKTYRFPQADDKHRFARIEVFHRVGHTTVNLDSLTGELQVPVDMPDLQLLPMKLAVNDSRAPAPRAQGKVEAAQRYLAEHHLEEVIADAIREVIHERPNDPHAFLSAQILKHAKGGQDSPKKSESKRSAPQELPFKDYYAAYMRSVPPCKMEPLYAKFPAQPKPAAKTMPAVATATPLAFGGRPSVGTWLMPKPKNFSASAIAQPEQKSVPFTAPFKDYYACHMRSVPPRNMEPLYAKFPASKPTPQAPPRPKQKSVPFTAPFKDYYACHMRSVPPCKMETLYAKFPKPASAAKTSAKTMPAVAAAPPVAFRMKPSVGTWLMPKPKNSFAAAIAQPEQKSVPFTAPFKDYYACHMRSVPPRNMEPLYAKFPASKPTPQAPPRPEQKSVPFTAPFKDYYACHMRSVPPRNMESLYAKFPAQQKPQPGSAQSQLEKAQAEMKEMEVQFQCEIKRKEEEFASQLHQKDEEIAQLKAKLEG